jgi:peptide/nickel transport system permease protein
MISAPRSPQATFRFRDNKIATLALAVLAAIVLAALLAPWISSQNPYDLGALDLTDARLAPGSSSADDLQRYWLGTDEQGRDLLSAILYGLRISLVVGVAGTLLGLLVGVALGLLAAMYGGVVDAAIMRWADIQLSVPAILIALVLLALTGPGISKIVFAVAVVQWSHVARIVRGTALVERQKDYVAAARCLGLSPYRVMARHILPNCLPTLIVVSTVNLASAISLEATLSFLGLGMTASEPSLGMLIADGNRYFLSGEYWISFFPGLALLLTMVAVNLLADNLREVLDPRVQAR